MIRANRTTEEKIAIVKDWMASGLSIEGYSKKTGVSGTSLFHWIKGKRNTTTGEVTGKVQFEGMPYPGEAPREDKRRSLGKALGPSKPQGYTPNTNRITTNDHAKHTNSFVRFVPETDLKQTNFELVIEGVTVKVNSDFDEEALKKLILTLKENVDNVRP